MSDNDSSIDEENATKLFQLSMGSEYFIDDKANKKVKADNQKDDIKNEQSDSSSSDSQGIPGKDNDTSGLLMVEESKEQHNPFGTISNINEPTSAFFGEKQEPIDSSDRKLQISALMQDPFDDIEYTSCFKRTIPDFQSKQSSSNRSLENALQQVNQNNITIMGLTTNNQAPSPKDKDSSSKVEISGKKESEVVDVKHTIHRVETKDCLIDKHSPQILAELTSCDPLSTESQNQGSQPGLLELDNTKLKLTLEEQSSYSGASSYSEEEKEMLSDISNTQQIDTEEVQNIFLQVQKEQEEDTIVLGQEYETDEFHSKATYST